MRACRTRWRVKPRNETVRSLQNGTAMALFSDMITQSIAAILHPGDLATWELLGIIVVLFALLVLPIVVIGFIVYRVVVTRSRDDDSSSPSTIESRATDS
jgi:hypothetical protein